MSHIMVDLETLSTVPTARIVAIGAVKFDATRGVYDKFYRAVLVPPFSEDCSFIDEEGFHISQDTRQWWAKQSAEARKVFTDPNAVGMDAALEHFANWIMTNDLPENVRLWGNGASFDNVILAEAYRIRNIDRPWMFWNDRCYRTVKHLHASVGYGRVGTHHNALDDAETQALHLLKMPVVLA